jgi:RND family efflux transporter MFP subunit
MRAALFVLVAGLTFPSAITRADDPAKEWDFIGHTQAAATVDARAQVTGQLTRLAVHEGDTVKKGDLLAEIDPRAYRIDLDAAKARLKMAEAKFQVAKIRADATKMLRDNKSAAGVPLPQVSDAEVAKAVAIEAEAAAAAMVAKAEVQRAELVLSWTRINAPFDGRVNRIQTSEGSLVTANQTHILTIGSTDPMYVSFKVDESLLLRLRREGLAEPGKLSVAVGFTGDKGYPHAAKLDVMSPDVDPTTGTARLRATIPSPKGLLLPGMSARFHLTVTPK